jgi:hypothetical protein
MTMPHEPESVTAGPLPGADAARAASDSPDDDQGHRFPPDVSAQGLLHPMTLGTFLPAVTSLLGSAALFTGIAFTFGYTYLGGYFGYFGVPLNVLGFSTHDYLLGSVSTLFYGMGILLLLGFLILRWHVTETRWRSGRRHEVALKVVSAVAAAVGSMALIGGVATSLRPSLLVVPSHALIAAGFLLITYAWFLRKTFARRRNLLRAAEGVQDLRWVPGVRGTLVAVGLLLSVWALLLAFAFWTGGFRARDEASRLHDWPLHAVVYSEKRLAMNAPRVRELTSTDAADAYRFVYDGLVMLWHSEDKYFFLPATWGVAHKVVFVVADTASVRVDFRNR